MVRSKDAVAMAAIKKALAPFRPRLKPRIVVVGAQKAGTSALFKMLAKHPSIIPPDVKELNFFNNDKTYSSGPGHYAKMLPVRPIWGKGWTTMDVTPGYLYHPKAAERIHQTLPNAVIAVILRDPVARAYSDWNMFRQFKEHPKYAHLYDARPFDQAIRKELDLASPTSTSSYLSRGYYAEQLERYYAHFPREQLLIFAYPQFRKEPITVVSGICAAAGLEPMVAVESLKNVKDNVRPYLNPIPEALRDELADHFKPHQEALWELIGTRLDLSEG